MAIIGTFTRKDDQFIGTVRTLTLDTKITLLPQAKRSANAPDFRAMAETVEIGAAWTKTSQGGNPYYLVKLDDPSFDKAVTARLVDTQEGWRLLWSR